MAEDRGKEPFAKASRRIRPRLCSLGCRDQNVSENLFMCDLNAGTWPTDTDTIGEISIGVKETNAKILLNWQGSYYQFVAGGSKQTGSFSSKSVVKLQMRLASSHREHSSDPNDG